MNYEGLLMSACPKRMAWKWAVVYLLIIHFMDFVEFSVTCLSEHFAKDLARVVVHQLDVVQFIGAPSFGLASESYTAGEGTSSERIGRIPPGCQSIYPLPVLYRIPSPPSLMEVIVSIPRTNFVLSLSLQLASKYRETTFGKARLDDHFFASLFSGSRPLVCS